MLISICIPTYNSGSKLERLLDSIKIQTFKDYEIIVSDDSRNNSVKEIIDTKYNDLNIKYYYNEIALGTPNNWNNAVAKSSGDWIKLMHHDDWFTNENSLATYIQYSNNTKAKLIFTAFNVVNLSTNSTITQYCSAIDIFLLKQNYLNLFKNFIGNPSCTLIHKSIKPYEYDKRIKWLIDFDFYLWYFKNYKTFVYINKPLNAFAIHNEQVTFNVQNNPSVEIPESFILFKKYGIGILKNIFVYDFFWRMYRNLNLKNIEELETYLDNKCIYQSVTNLIHFQQKIKPQYLKIGIISKSIMLFSYIKNLFI